ncbi:Protein CBG09248 [Caenorhabditis briggsae]|uniref:Protein CBG09248 n=2 Tax=Caenorhabditis briggsae TaxID=6238 RepID=A8X9J1_CAEBR|nr:Protein CBG09248 [Caenorhabditis briggsae]ULT90162.1 hypothetical protein L3Y34_008496 [Caenorhabditis briggsae]CAP29303.1 Protein CBG09248 [Caenorhabditis briggsae]
MVTQQAKILCCGDVNGNFVDLIKKLTVTEKKNGPFDSLFCVGEFFGDDDEANEKVINGNIEFPIPTYILGPSNPRYSYLYPEESIEFSANLTYLGKKGLLNTASGLQIAYLSGVEGTSKEMNCFDKSDIDELLVPLGTQVGFSGTDILLTSMWPAEVARHSHNQPSKPVAGSVLLSKLVSQLKPRYHFAGLGVHYERQPYRNHRVLLEPARHTTRFIGLAPVNNPEKQKWLYACNVKPMRKMEKEELTAQPPNASEFPYRELLEEMAAKETLDRMNGKGQRPEGSQYRFEMGGPEDGGGRKRHNNGGDDGPRNKQPAGPCWFCLSNVDAEKHLVVAIGTHCYAAMPKGPLTEDHVMVLSVGHIQSQVAAPVEVRDEIEKFKNVFTLMANKQGKALVTFERNFRTQHLQVQMVMVDKSSTKALKSSFTSAAACAGFELVTMGPDENLLDMVNEGCPYFVAELPDGSKLFTRNMKGFPLQFGREVLASTPILDCEDKVDWKSCVLAKEKETELVNKLKADFKPFDFTADDDSD